MNQMTITRVAFAAVLAMFLILTPQAVSEQFNLVSSVKEAQGWPTVTGVVKNVDRKEEFGSRHRSSGWHVIVDYDYKVNGSSYSGQQKAFLTAGQLLTNTMFDESHSAELANRFATGKSVLVYYNKNAPSQSFVDVEISNAAYLPFVALPVVDLILVGVMILLFNPGAVDLLNRNSRTFSRQTSWR
ncbi:MAG TPA: DUF3592 domain-containing protein [Drouetiella sp.]|jgi:Protein of unknown function (DUF3592)